MYTGPTIIKDGLILYLDAANPKSYLGTGAIWKDLSGNVNDGTLINGPVFNSSNGGNIVFDGVNDYINLGPTVDNNLTWTMSSWFYMLTNTTNHRALIGNSGTSPAGAGRFMGVANDSANPNVHRKPWVILYNSSGVQSQIFGNTTILGNTWYNITTTHTGTNALVYVNGVVDQTPFNIDGYLPSNNILTIGLLRALYWPFPGNIANIKLYNRELTSTEILQNYNATKSRFGL